MAQEWLLGDRYCSCSVIQDAQLEATALCPALETVDGYNSVSLPQKFYPGIYDYLRGFISSIPAFNGQIDFDFIDNADGT